MSRRPIQILAPREKTASISRRALLAGFGVLAGTGIAGCSAGTKVASSALPDGKTENLLNVYSWGDYSDPDDIKRFTKKYGPNVQIASFGSNQEMIAKLSATRGTSGYDIVVPTDVFVPQMADHKLLQKLDKSRIPNFSKMDPAYIHQAWDPHSDYAICKASGTTGFMYDTSVIKRDLTSWADFLDAVQKEASGTTALQTDPWEVCCCYFAAHGESPNTTNTKTLDACEKFMVNKIAPHIKAYLSTATSAVSQGGFTLLHAYNGDARQAILASKHPDDWKFVYPTPTANLWMDTWAIARGTQHPDAAYEFINYMLEPKVSYTEMQYIGYATGVSGVEARARRDKLKFTDLIFPPERVMKRLTPAKLNSATERQNEILNKTMARSGA